MKRVCLFVLALLATAAFLSYRDLEEQYKHLD
jgi:hypothetical protein